MSEGVADALFEVGEVRRLVSAGCSRQSRHGDGGKQRNPDHCGHEVDEQNANQRHVGIERGRGEWGNQSERRLHAAVDSIDSHQLVGRHNLRQQRRYCWHLNTGTHRANRHHQENQPEVIDAREHQKGEP